MNIHKLLHKTAAHASQVFPGATFNWTSGTSVRAHLGFNRTLEFYVIPSEVNSSRGNRGFSLWVADARDETQTMLNPHALNPDWVAMTEWMLAYKDTLLNDISETLEICGADFSFTFPSRPPVQRFSTLTDVLVKSPRLIFVTSQAAVGKTSWVHRLAYDYLIEEGRPVHALTGDMTAPDYLGKFYERYPRVSQMGIFSVYPEVGKGIEVINWVNGLTDKPGLVIIDSPFFVMDQSMAEQLKGWALENDAHVVVTRQARRTPTGGQIMSEVSGVESLVDLAMLLERDKTNIVPEAFLLKDRDEKGRGTAKAPIHIKDS
jgi:hypothetical protein